MKEESKGLFRKKSAILLIIAIVAFSSYFSSINSSFHFDDFVNIVVNPDVTINAITFKSLKQASFSKVSGLRPVPYISFALNHYFGGLDTTSYHAVNIIIHIINAFLIYLIILNFSAAEASGKEIDMKAFSAFFTAVIWLCIPVNSQPVIYIVQRMVLLQTIFFLAAFYCYLVWRKKGRALFLVLTVTFFALSLLSKQNAVVFPIIIVLYEFIFTKKGDAKNVTKKEMIISAALLSAFLLILLLYKDAIIFSIEKGYEGRDFSMYERMLTQGRVLMFYLSLIALPLPGRLSITHDIAKSVSLTSPISTLGSLIFLAAVIAVAIVRRKKSPYLSFAVIWFFITIFVESSILPLEMAYEHRLYLPDIFLIGAFINFLTGKMYETNRRTLVALLCAAVMLFCVLTNVRGKAWENDLTLWSDVAKKYPENARAYYNIGYVYYLQNDFGTAIKWFEKSLEKNPDYPEVLFGFGDIYEIKGNLKDAESYYDKALNAAKEGEDIYLQTLNNLGVVYYKTGRFKESLEAFKKMALFSPTSGFVHYNIGQALAALNDLEGAVSENQIAIDYGYDKSEVYEDTIKILTKFGDPEIIEKFYENNKEKIDKSCYGYFINFLIAKSKNDTINSKKYYDAYFNCKKAQISNRIKKP